MSKIRLFLRRGRPVFSPHGLRDHIDDDPVGVEPPSFGAHPRLFAGLSGHDHLAVRHNVISLVAARTLQLSAGRPAHEKHIVLTEHPLQIQFVSQADPGRNRPGALQRKRVVVEIRLRRRLPFRRCGRRLAGKQEHIVALERIFLIPHIDFPVELRDVPAEINLTAISGNLPRFAGTVLHKPAKIAVLCGFLLLARSRHIDRFKVSVGIDPYKLRSVRLEHPRRLRPRRLRCKVHRKFVAAHVAALVECMNIAKPEERIARFFAKLDAMLDITARQLHERMEFQKTAFAKQFPLLMSSLWLGCDQLRPDDTIAPVINQGTLGIGFIGLAECLVALTGKHHGESAEAQELGLKIITYMRDRANEFSEKYQHNYSILATPAEGLSGKFTRADRQQFGVLAGITDREYYTNSNHVPVYYKCSARHKAEVEAPYHDLTRGGHIFYVEIDGDATHNPEAIMRVVDMMDRYNIGYGSVNHNRNRCMDCGYENSDDHLDACPKCGSTRIDRLQRITGYLVGTTDRWNKAKLAELNDRVIHQ